ncbi:uncharacterized protein FPRO_16025 [Fusarium proliferatum ET1]|uniref:Zn(2)-C6 fungal-type domain-containing protein n=1 Tax=Fusarium proliferatum (strain ET1) TaxID=1227346 RepID=A0A1L7WB09_FUSPR|nr:uncharacterized protein FPRO_16025 [Fusarium proliferatum ET1]CZR49817.1 uncharacterized protein FPRO_16025 [Fusarium proliferatum ET1]
MDCQLLYRSKVDKSKKNKLSYDRARVACHCRKRKIRCVRPGDDRQTPCASCSRLKRECNLVSGKAIDVAIPDQWPAPVIDQRGSDTFNALELTSSLSLSMPRDDSDAIAAALNQTYTDFEIELFLSQPSSNLPGVAESGCMDVSWQQTQVIPLAWADTISLGYPILPIFQSDPSGSSLDTRSYKYIDMGPGHRLNEVYAQPRSCWELGALGGFS